MTTPESYVPDTQAWILATVQMLVDHPDEVKVNFVCSTNSTIAEIALNAADVGQLIGRDGSTIRSIRLLLANHGRCVGGGKAFYLHVINGPKRRRTRRTPNSQGDQDELL